MLLQPRNAEIPDALIAAQEKGEVLFVCGAGVSASQGLPSFRGLVERVYAELKEDWHSAPAEAQAMKDKQYDRVLRALERRLAAKDLPRSQGMRERIRAAVKAALTPPKGVKFANHNVLLGLSKDAEGRSRILTTNFDTLFERTLKAQGVHQVDSFWGPSLPRPKSANFRGVLHLHGRLDDEDLGLQGTDFVLTSADFGDAYLRSGWASRYVYDLARTHTLVLVGYGADDPPMRYLLEALEADRERYPDLREPYALAPAVGGEEELQEALWLSKGVRPILYKLGQEGDHESLYSLLRSWAHYRKDPVDWRAGRLRTLMSRPPNERSSSEIEETTALLRHGSSEQSLANISPLPEWLPTLHRARVFDEDRICEGPWLATQLGVPAMVRACAAGPRLSERSRWFVSRALGENRHLSPECIKAWRLILSAAEVCEGQSPPWYGVKNRVSVADIDHHVRQSVVETYKPRLTVGKPWRDDFEEGSVASLVRVRFEPTRNAPEPSEILGLWPSAGPEVQRLLSMLVRETEDSLEQAADAGLDSEVVSSGVAPLFLDKSDYGNGFSPIVRLVAELWTRLAETDPGAAGLVCQPWCHSPFLLLRRLYLHAETHSTVLPASKVQDRLRAMDHRAFWFESENELLHMLGSRWRSFDELGREEMLARICAGIPPETIRGEFDDEDRIAASDRAVFERLSFLKSKGEGIGDSAQKTLDAISTRNPDWQAYTEESLRPTIMVQYGPQGDTATLADIEESELVEAAMRLQQERFVENRDVWRLLCDSNPERALRGLSAAGSKGEWPVAAWRNFFWAAAALDRPSLQLEVSRHIKALPAAELGELAPAVTEWLRRSNAQLLSLGIQLAEILTIWDALADYIYVPGDVAQSINEGDLDFAALNEPGGVLSIVLLDLLRAELPGSGEQTWAVPRLNRFVQCAGRAGLLGRVTIALHVPWLHVRMPAWVEQYMVPRFSENCQESEILWQSRARGVLVTEPALFGLLKPHLLAACRRARFREPHLGQLVAQLLCPTIWSRQAAGPKFDVTPAEVRSVLRDALPEVREAAARVMREWLDSGKENASEKWRKLVGPFFHEAWPIDEASRDAEVSLQLVRTALLCGDAFPEALRAVIDVLVPFEMYSIELVLGDGSVPSAASSFPAQFIQLLNAIVDRQKPPRDLRVVLMTCASEDNDLIGQEAFDRLMGIARAGEA